MGHKEETMSMREPAVAGMFYPAEAAALKNQIESCFKSPGGPGRLPVVNLDGPRDMVGLVCPHAGYVYSGSVAACGYYFLAEDGLPDTVVILGPNHRAAYPSAALTDQRAWLTPFGEVAVDASLSRHIVKEFPLAEIDPMAHFAEHSLEVQLPFLQYLCESANKSLSIVPILIGAEAYDNALEFAEGLGSTIADAVRDRNVLIIASTDFTHYESGESALEKDSQAVSEILAFDENGLLSVVNRVRITMCGVLPTIVCMTACRKLGVVGVEKLAYQSSGDVTGDYSEVVGYASVAFYR